MAIDFTAVLNHNLKDTDIYALPDLLNSTWQAVERFLPIIEGDPAPGSSPGKLQWDEEEAAFSLERLRTRGAMIVGHEFGGSVSERVFRIHTGIRWFSFLTDQTVRDKLLRVCRHTASVFGANQILYLPCGFLRPEGASSLMFEGKAVEEMVEWLLEHCGPPVEDIESIYRGDPQSWNENGYYIDRI